MMKKIKIGLMTLIMMLFSASLFAVTLNSTNDVDGSWSLAFTKKSESATDSDNGGGVTWEFKNGKLTKKGISVARESRTYDTEPVEYIVEEGNLKISILGRAGKFDVYSVEQLTGNEMVLKDTKFGSLMYFKKK